MDEAARVRRGHHLRPQLHQLLDRVERDVARAGDDGDLAAELRVARREHVPQEINRAVAGRLGAHLTAAEGEPLAGQHAGEPVRQPHVLAEEVADLARADADVTGRDVDVVADVAVQLAHHRLAEAHHLVVALPARVEVRASLRAPHRQSGQTVLQDLLEAEELQHATCHGRVEAEPAFVGPDRVRELHAPGAVGVDRAVVALPGNAERDDPVRLGQPLEDLQPLVFRVVLLDERDDRLGHFPHRLVELRFPRVATAQPLHEVRDREGPVPGVNVHGSPVTPAS